MFSVKIPLFSSKSNSHDTICCQGDEKRVYEFVVRHFLACVSQDAQGFETTVEIDVAQETVSLMSKFYIPIPSTSFYVTADANLA